MSEKQKTSELTAFAILFLGILLLFFLLVPKVASTLFPQRRQMILQNFLSTVVGQDTIHPQAFWQFREFYSPGSYTFNKNGIDPAQVLKIEKRASISFRPNVHSQVFLAFTSPHLVSLEALVTTNSLKNTIITGNIKKTSLLAKNNEVLFTDEKGNIYVIFLKSTQDMATANGFFDYTGVDKSIIQGKYWLDITVLDGK